MCGKLRWPPARAFVIRETTEGEYSSIGGRIFEGSERETVIQESIFTRQGTDRILKFAFDLARQRPKTHVTSATKSNGTAISMPCWDERLAAMAGHYPDVRWDKDHIDILSALGPACTGTIGIAPSANPIAMIWSGAMMLDVLGNGNTRYNPAHDAIMQAIEHVLVAGPRTPDMGGTAGTVDRGIAGALIISTVCSAITTPLFLAITTYGSRSAI